jgi:hypothetical protein
MSALEPKSCCGGLILFRNTARHHLQSVIRQCPKHHLAGLALSRGCFGVVPCLVGCLGPCNVSAGCGDQP